MALNTDPNFPPSGPAPYQIDREWCLGDSLTYINLNSANFDSRLENKFDKTGGTITGSLTANGRIDVSNIISATGQIYSASSVNTAGTISATGQIYSGTSFSTVGTIFASSTITTNGQIFTGSGGAGGAITFNVPGYGLSRYWGGGTWTDIYGFRIGVASNGDMYVAGVSTLPVIVSNNIYSYNYYNISDERLKENITPLQNSLNTVLNLNGISYVDKNTKRKQIGFSAQQVKPILPEVVTEAENSYLSLSYTSVVAVLVEAIKELNAKVVTLENQITQLPNNS